MTPILIRHYVHPQRSEAENATGLTLGRLISAHAPRFAALDLSLDLEVVPCDAPEDRNRVTFSYPMPSEDDEPPQERERSLEDLLGLAVVVSPGAVHRTLVYEGQSYDAIPPGLLADGLLRVAMALMGGGGCGSSCAGCQGCGA